MARIGLVLLFAGAAFAQDWKAKLEEAIAEYHSGSMEQALATLREAERLAEEAHAEATDVAALERSLAAVLRGLGQRKEAEEHIRRALTLQAKAAGDLDLEAARLRMQLATLELENGKPDDAELDLCTALDTFGDANVLDTSECLMRLASVAVRRGSLRTADRLVTLARGNVESGRGSDALEAYASVAYHAGWLLIYVGELQKAEEPLRLASDAYGRLRESSSYDALGTTELLIDLLTRQRRLEEAAGLATKTVASLRHGSPDLATFQLRLARIDLAREDAKSAAAHLEQASAAFTPGDERYALALETRAALRLLQGQADAARVDALSALTVTSKDVHALLEARTCRLLAQIESTRGAEAEATRRAEQAAVISLRLLGVDNPGTRAAISDFETCREKALEAGVAAANLPVLKGFRVGEAIEPAAAETDAKVKALYEKASDLQKRGGSERALSLLDEAIAFRPGEPRLHAARALVLGALRREADAVAALDAEIAWSIEPLPREHAVRAGHQVLLRHHGRAVVDATYAILLGDTEPGIYNVRGLARLGLLDRIHIELGLRDLDVCLKAWPGDASVQYLRGIALWYLKRFEDAATAYRAALDGGVQVSQSCAKLAQFERRAGHADESLALATRALQADDAPGEAHGIRAFLYLDRGRWADALADFRSWSDETTLRSQILQWICRAHLGDREAATAALREATEHATDGDPCRATALAILGTTVPKDAPMPESADDRETYCRAHFLLGAWREIEGDLDGAKERYRRAVDTNSTEVLEYESAKEALARLTAAK